MLTKEEEEMTKDDWKHEREILRKAQHDVRNKREKFLGFRK